MPYNIAVKAEIIAIGNELLLGEISDTNSSYIAGELPRLGVDLYWISIVGDNRERLLEVLRRAWSRSDVIFTTGGLGPSEGDITRLTIAALLGEEISIDPGVVAGLKARFQRLGREMTPSNIKQADIIPSAKFIPNSRGTAPGWWVEKDGHIIIAMPGHPGENHFMWQNEVMPRLKQIVSGDVIITRTIKTWGLSESAINETLLPLFSSPNPTLAIYARADGVQVRIAAKASSEEKASEMISPVEARIRSSLGDAVWGADNDTMENAAAVLLAEKKLDLAVIENFTGGLFAATVCDSSSTAFFKGGIVIGSGETTKVGGISINYENAEALADAARTNFSSDIGIGITGVIASQEQSGTLPDEVHIGIAFSNNKKTVVLRSMRDRVRAKRWVVSAALFELIRALRNL